VLVATATALLLVPAAQAVAAGNMTVEFGGTGSGEISSVGGYAESGVLEGEVPIECTGPPTSGTCETPLEEFEGKEGLALHAVADPGSEFVGWSVEEGMPVLGGCVGDESRPTECVVVVEEGGTDTRVKALFAASGGTPQFTLSINKSGTGSGTVTSSPAGINCGATCSAEFDEGTVVTLSQSAAAGSEFKEWTGACSGSGSCEVTMSAAKSVGVKFDTEPPPTFSLTVTKSGSGSGSVTCNAGSCAVSYPQGTVVTLAAQAASGSTFAGWSGGGCSGTGDCVVTINANTTVDAGFAATGSGGGGGTGGGGTPPPAEEKCIVPKLKSKTLGQAKSALRSAHCAIGKVTKPKKGKKGKKLGPLVVKSTSPAAGAQLPANSKVAITLKHAPKKK
jgi:hypothetical protein